MFCSKRKKIGFTLLETVISTGAFAVVLGSLFVVVKIGTNSWLHVQSQRTAQVMMRNIEAYMMDDLRRSGLSSSQIATKKVSIDTSNNNTVLWFLSAMGYDDDENRKEVFTRSTSGQPIWKRNIIYFVTPISQSWHINRYGFECPNINDCPHKLLIRKEVVWPSDGTSTTDPAGYQPSVLISNTDIGEFIPSKFPDSMDLSKIMRTKDNYGVMAESEGSSGDKGKKRMMVYGCKRIVCLADCIKDFSVDILDGSTTALYGSASDSQAIKQYGLDINISAFRADEAARHVSVQEVTHSDSIDQDTGNSYIVKYNIRIMPNN